MLASFLDCLSDKLGNESCNDMFMDDTPENRALIAAAQQWQHADDKHAFESAEDAATVRTYTIRKGKPPMLSTHNTVILDYLRNRFMQENSVSRDELRDPENW